MSRPTVVVPDALPAGVSIRPLDPHVDTRGKLVELYRVEWDTGCEAKQWNAVKSEANVLRGVHVHVRHTDYLTVLSGTMILGLHDLRPESRTTGMSCMLRLGEEEPRAVMIPPGVCHGFFFPVPSIHIYAVSEYWDLRDELGCRFDSGELLLEWPTTTPVLSERDRSAGTFTQMQKAFGRQWLEFIKRTPE